MYVCVRATLIRRIDNLFILFLASLFEKILQRVIEY